ncbi:MAG: DUF2934 domain-containing protein [Betaproteobacteria bacterium]|nr:DUF2934 domain-containing protein [Betaproteobacteria bacterium]
MPEVKGTSKSNGKKLAGPAPKASAEERGPKVDVKAPAQPAPKAASQPEAKKPVTAALKPAAPSAPPKSVPEATATEPKHAASVPTAKKPGVAGNGERKAGAKKLQVTPEQRYRMISEAAYYRAEARGFRGGDPAQDWIDAEIYIDQLLQK